MGPAGKKGGLCSEDGCIIGPHHNRSSWAGEYVVGGGDAWRVYRPLGPPLQDPYQGATAHGKERKEGKEGRVVHAAAAR